jgi:hypothetical protein
MAGGEAAACDFLPWRGHPAWATRRSSPPSVALPADTAMPVYCVSYDLNKLGQNYAYLHEELRSSGTWWHHLGTTWLVHTSEAAEQLSTRLRKALDDNDSLLVIKVTRDYAGWLPKKAWEWIEQHL